MSRRTTSRRRVVSLRSFKDFCVFVYFHNQFSVKFPEKLLEERQRKTSCALLRYFRGIYSYYSSSKPISALEIA